MLVRRRRRWTNIGPTLGQWLGFATNIQVAIEIALGVPADGPLRFSTREYRSTSILPGKGKLQ